MGLGKILEISKKCKGNLSKCLRFQILHWTAFKQSSGEIRSNESSSWAWGWWCHTGVGLWLLPRETTSALQHGTCPHLYPNIGAFPRLTSCEFKFVLECFLFVQVVDLRVCDLSARGCPGPVLMTAEESKEAFKWWSCLPCAYRRLFSSLISQGSEWY